MKILLQVLLSLCFIVSAYADGKVLGWPAGGAAASGVYRPDGDIAVNSWFDSDIETTSLYLEIDDAVTSPTAGDTTQIREYAAETVYEFSVAHIVSWFVRLMSIIFLDMLYFSVILVIMIMS